MGKKKPETIRVVLDTNVLISSLLFEGLLSKFVSLWKTKRITPLISEETLEEIANVLRYPKFSLSEKEQKFILEQEILPYFEVVSGRTAFRMDCRDLEDKKFLACAFLGKAQYLVTGDADLLELQTFQSIEIIAPAYFLEEKI